MYIKYPYRIKLESVINNILFEDKLQVTEPIVPQIMASIIYSQTTFIIILKTSFVFRKIKKAISGESKHTYLNILTLVVLECFSFKLVSIHQLFMIY